MQIQIYACMCLSVVMLRYMHSYGYKKPKDEVLVFNILVIISAVLRKYFVNGEEMTCKTSYKYYILKQAFF